MLKIRKDQINIFQPDAEEDFVRRVMNYVRERHGNRAVKLPGETVAIPDISDELLRSMVKGGIARAREYGITWQSSLISYVVLMFLTAPNFDEHQTINQYLTDEKIEADRRMDKMMDEVPNRIWREVRGIYEPGEWNLNYETENV